MRANIFLLSFLNGESVVLIAVTISIVWVFSFYKAFTFVLSKIQFSFPSVNSEVIKEKERKRTTAALCMMLNIEIYSSYCTKRLRIEMTEIIYLSFVLHLGNINEM